MEDAERSSVRDSALGPILRDLRREAGSPNRFQRLVRRFARTRLGARLFSAVLRPADAAVLRLTSGRMTLTQPGAGVPVIVLRAHGARTGRPLVAPLAAIPLERGVAVIGSNFGSPSTPRWAQSLASRADVEVEHGGRRAAVRARRLEGEEATAAFVAACAVYPPFSAYVQHVTIREVPIFLLEPRG